MSRPGETETKNKYAGAWSSSEDERFLQLIISNASVIDSAAELGRTVQAVSAASGNGRRRMRGDHGPAAIKSEAVTAAEKAIDRRSLRKRCANTPTEPQLSGRKPASINVPIRIPDILG